MTSGTCGGWLAAVPPAHAVDKHDATHEALVAAASGPTRKPEERARDAYRHPVETLETFGIRPDMKVVELSPGGGWYTAILAPLLEDNGELAITSADPNGPPDDEGTKLSRALQVRLQSSEAFAKVKTRTVRAGEPLILGEDGSVDMVVTFRSVHNWVAGDRLGIVLAAVHRVLKTGGVLGVEAHRANAGAPTDKEAADKTGYLPEAFVIAQMEAAGFTLTGKSEVNANPRDTKNHPKGVWTLPPTFELGDTDRARYAAIGESDRMTLKFVKR